MFEIFFNRGNKKDFNILLREVVENFWLIYTLKGFRFFKCYIMKIKGKKEKKYE